MTGNTVAIKKNDKRKNNDIQNTTQNIKDRGTRAPLKPEGGCRILYMKYLYDMSRTDMGRTLDVVSKCNKNPIYLIFCSDLWAQ